MSLSAGAKLGPYEIQSAIGAGGMGEVYRARDTRLDRTVAIKILPAHLSSDTEAKQRFDREARAISSLNHANICTLHDVGHQDGVDYLVMEYLEGETLAERLLKGPLPTEQVLRYGTDICEGLERAHKTGVIHRDLKPGNIMLTKSGAKLMDFGLAKSAVAAVSASSLSGVTFAPDKPLTSAGTVVGTFQYISPEQVEGKEADARSDIFALGAVLYEMATGKRAFEGKTTASVIAAVLERDPEPISSVRPMSPPALDRLVKACVAKDPDDRIQTVHDVKLQLKWMADGGSQTGIPITVSQKRKSRERLAWVVAALAVLSAIGLAVFQFSNQKAAHVLVAQIDLPAGLTLNSVGDTSGAPVISPDGAHLVFSAIGEDGNRLYVRALDNAAVTPLPGTENAIFPFWSPDSRSVGFFSGAKLKRIEIAGGTPVDICDAPNARGGSWNKDGVIIFAPNFNSGLQQVAATGGAPTEAVKLDGSKYTTYRWPWFLPDGKHFLYLAANHNQATGPDNRILVASLDGKENRPLFPSLSNAIYASGHLLYLRGNSLMAQPFDPASAKIKGPPAMLNDHAQLDASLWRETVTASDTGTLLYQTGGAASKMQLTWFDRSGKMLSTLDENDGALYQVQLSPDEKRLALVVEGVKGMLETYDLASKRKTRLTFGNLDERNPVWSPDGSQIAYSLMKAGAGTSILSKAGSGAGQPEQLLAPIPGEGEPVALNDWSRDGRYMIFHRGTIGGVGRSGQNLWILPLFGDRKIYVYPTGPGDQDQAQFSPDGRWIAYMSTESGHLEVYVAPFPATGAKWQISNGNAEVPRWRADGKELFFQQDGVQGIMAVEVNGTGPSFETGEPHMLFRANAALGYQGMQYAVTKDGQRFVVITTGTQSSTPLFVLENWTAKLRNN
ncbi:MAG: protein kinase [Acidobacteriaceae bacterium]